MLGALTASVAAPAAEKRSWDLRHHRGDGDKTAYQLSLAGRVKVEGEVEGQMEVTRGEMTLRAECTAEYAGTTEEGDQRIAGRILSGTYAIDGEGGKDSLDLGQVICQYVISPAGDLRAHRITSGDPPLFFFPGLTLVFGPEDAFLAGGVLVFPDRPVEVGETWRGTALRPRAGGAEPVRIPYESKLVAVEQFRGRECLKIETSCVGKQTRSAPVPGAAATGHFESTLASEHVLRFDPERGIIMFDEGTINVVVHARADKPDGDSMAFDTSAVINTRSALTQFNGETMESGRSSG
jgi:hypothetical protein